MMNNIVMLLHIKDGYGHSATDEIMHSLIVWGDVKMPSTSFKINAQSAGMKVDLIIHLWRREFDQYNFTHVEIDGKRYKIIATGSSINDLMVKLTVARC